MADSEQHSSMSGSRYSKAAGLCLALMLVFFAIAASCASHNLPMWAWVVPFILGDLSLAGSFACVILLSAEHKKQK